MRSALRRSIRIVLASAAVVIMFLAIVGFTYEQLGRNRDSHHRFRIGRAVDVGGRTLNIDCSGEGSPTVLLLPTRFGGYGGYIKVRPEVSKFTRVCWYDRAGEGWSDPPPTPPTSASISNDLHELLRRALVPGPYVLVGHSIGGDFARIYAGRFPSEVAGLVLVDSANPDQNEPAIMLAPINRMPTFVRQLVCWANPVASRFGVTRFFLRNQPIEIPPGLSTDDSDAVTQALRDQYVKYEETENAQACAATQNGSIKRKGGSGNPEIDDAARRVSNLGSMPIIVLTGDQYWKPDDDPVAAQQITEFHQTWVHQLQPALAHLSTQGRQIILANSDHGIPDQAPDAVIDAIRSIVTQGRRHAE